MTSVLCYISRRSTGKSHKPGSHAGDELVMNKMVKGEAMQMDGTTAYGVASVSYRAI